MKVGPLDRDNRRRATLLHRMQTHHGWQAVAGRRGVRRIRAPALAELREAVARSGS